MFAGVKVAIIALRKRHDLVARGAALALIVLLVIGWGAAHYPMLVAPDVTIGSAASPEATLRALVPIMIGGAVILLPSLWWLMRVFKSKE